MHDAAKVVLLRLLKVPAEPKPPEGTAESVRVFRAGRNFYYWRLLQWAALQLGIGLLVAGAFLGPKLVKKPPKKPPPAWLVMAWDVMGAGAMGLFAATLPLTYFKQRIDYEMRWYIVTDRCLRVRSGIWSVSELTMTFANVQDIRISAGPLQRLLGLADVKVTSAGGGGGSEQLETAHMAVFAGVDCAEAICDLIIGRLREYRDAGLGDPDDKQRHAAGGPERAATVGATLVAAQLVLAEARQLRAVLERGDGA